MRFVLVRHGQSTANVAKIIAGHGAAPLTELGKEQAKSLGIKLLKMGVKFDAVYSSDLRRAFETATILCNELGIEDITFDKRLREGDAGILTGKNVDNLTKEERALFDSILVNLDERVPGGETNNEQMMRTKDVFLEIVENPPDAPTILLVGHVGT